MPKKLTDGQRLRAKTAANERLQTFVNLAADFGDAQKAWLLALIAAISANADLPQYANHWDDWKLGLMQRDITTKFGKSFLVGDWVLVKPDTNEACRTACRTAYSIRTGIDTSINHLDVKLAC